MSDFHNTCYVHYNLDNMMLHDDDYNDDDDVDDDNDDDDVDDDNNRNYLENLTCM